MAKRHSFPGAVQPASKRFRTSHGDTISKSPVVDTHATDSTPRAGKARGAIRGRELERFLAILSRAVHGALSQLPDPPRVKRNGRNKSKMPTAKRLKDVLLVGIMDVTRCLERMSDQKPYDEAAMPLSQSLLPDGNSEQGLRHAHTSALLAPVGSCGETSNRIMGQLQEGTSRPKASCNVEGPEVKLDDSPATASQGVGGYMAVENANNISGQAESKLQKYNSCQALRIVKIPMPPLLLVIEASDYMPQGQAGHVAPMAARVKVPVIAISGGEGKGSARLGEALGLRTAIAVGIRAGVPELEAAARKLLEFAGLS